MWVLGACGPGMQLKEMSSFGAQDQENSSGNHNGSDSLGPVFPDLEMQKVSELAQSAEEALLEAEELLRSELDTISNMSLQALGQVSTQSLSILGLADKLARPLDKLANSYAQLKETTDQASVKLDEALARLVGSDPLYLVLLARIHGAQEKLAQVEQRLQLLHVRVMELVARAESQVNQLASQMARSRNVLENLLAIELYALRGELTKIRQRLASL